MESVQTMRWILVWMTGASALIALALGYIIPGIVLLFGVFLHTVHWYTGRTRPAAESPDS